MYTEISFPSLGLTMNPPRGLEIGSFNIYFYGMIIALGMVLAVFYASRRSKEFGIKEDDLLDAVLWVTPFAILQNQKDPPDRPAGSGCFGIPDRSVHGPLGQFLQSGGLWCRNHVLPADGSDEPAYGSGYLLPSHLLL